MAASAVACLLSHTSAGEALILRVAGGAEAAELVAPLRLLFVVGVTTVTWLVVTFATRPGQVPGMPTRLAGFDPEGLNDGTRVPSGSRRKTNGPPSGTRVRRFFTWSVLWLSAQLSL